MGNHWGVSVTEEIFKGCFYFCRFTTTFSFLETVIFLDKKEWSNEDILQLNSDALKSHWLCFSKAVYYIGVLDSYVRPAMTEGEHKVNSESKE